MIQICCGIPALEKGLSQCPDTDLFRSTNIGIILYCNLITKLQVS